MDNINYFNEFPSAVTICDTDGIVIYMNRKAELTFEKWGGAKLIGKSLFDCHNPKSVDKIREIIKSEKAHTYTIEKNGVKKLINQSPWFKEGKIAGIIEISIELPNEMVNHIR